MNSIVVYRLVRISWLKDKIVFTICDRSTLMFPVSDCNFVCCFLVYVKHYERFTIKNLFKDSVEYSREENYTRTHIQSYRHNSDINFSYKNERFWISSFKLVLRVARSEIVQRKNFSRWFERDKSAVLTPNSYSSLTKWNINVFISKTSINHGKCCWKWIKKIVFEFSSWSFFAKLIFVWSKINFLRFN